jgi:hypothetical protein
MKEMVFCPLIGQVCPQTGRILGVFMPRTDFGVPNANFLTHFGGQATSFTHDEVLPNSGNICVSIPGQNLTPTPMEEEMSRNGQENGQISLSGDFGTEDPNFETKVPRIPSLASIDFEDPELTKNAEFKVTGVKKGENGPTVGQENCPRAQTDSRKVTNPAVGQNVSQNALGGMPTNEPPLRANMWSKNP